MREMRGAGRLPPGQSLTLKWPVLRRKAKQPVARLPNNHREVIAAFDFFTVPTLWFRTLYCFFAIEHDRRRILHFNVTFHPTSEWIMQQLREAFPLPCPYRTPRGDSFSSTHATQFHPAA